MCLSLFPEPLDIPRNALNSAASSLRWNRANGQLPFSNWRRHFSFKTTVTVLQDWAFQPQTRRKYVTNWAKGLCVICLKKTDKCKKNITSSPKQWLNFATKYRYDRHMIEYIWMILKSELLPKKHDIKSFRYFLGSEVGFWPFESTTLLHNVGNSLPNDTASYRRRYELSKKPLW